MRIDSVCQKYPKAELVRGSKFRSRKLFVRPLSRKRSCRHVNFADSIRCDNMDDGLYALDCSDKVAVCSAGWKRIYGCPQGQLFIPSLIRCDESWKCTNTNPCGPGFVGVVYLGKVESITPSISFSLIGKF